MSQVGQQEGRERLTRSVAVASLVASSAYITWRWGWTLDRETLWFSLPLVLAETFGVLSALLLTITAWRLSRRRALPPLPGRTVDVFVTTAFEPIAIIRKTALAAREIRYPHTTWLLDDGHRDEVRAVAEEIGIRYLRREDRSHAKAGNLNHALAQSTGEFLLQLDADHVPLPQIVDRLIGFFEDERVAFAQSPQDFYNTDAYTDHHAAGRGRQLWGDQQLFFNVMQPGKDRCDAAIFVGSCAMLRRSALDEIGGFAPHTSMMGTETSLLLHAAGWRSAYLNENLAFGLAPATAHAYQVQQLHRTQGAMRLLRRYQPLAMPGLTPLQRAMYLDMLTTPLGGVQRVILYLAPIVFLTTGVFPIRASIGTFVALFAPAMLLRAVSFKLLTRGQGSLLLTERYWMAKFFTHLLAVRAYLTHRRLNYRDRPDEAGSVPFRTVAPQLVLIGATALALGWAIYSRTIGYEAEVPGWGPFALYGAVLLALWHAGLAGHVAQLSLAGRHRRGEHRFAESLSVTLRVLREDGKLSSTDIAMTEDLTATGLALRGMYPVPSGARVEISLPLSSGEVNVRGRVVRHSTIETRLGTVHLVGVEFDSTSRETRDAIELHCAQHAMPIEQQRSRQTPLGTRAVRRLRDPRANRRVAIGMPARVMSGTGDDMEEVGVGLLEEVSTHGGRVVLDHPVTEGRTLTLHIPGSSAEITGRVVFVHALRTGVGMRFVAGFETELPPVPEGAEEATAPWYAAVVAIASRYGDSAAQGSRVALEAVARGSRTTVERVTVGSRAAAETLAGGSRVAAERLVGGSRVAAERLAESSRLAADSLSRTSRAAADRLATQSRDVATRIVEGSRAAARAVSPPAVASADLLDDAVERIDLEPLSPEALAAIAARAVPPAPVEPSLPEDRVQPADTAMSQPEREVLAAALREPDREPVLEPAAEAAARGMPAEQEATLAAEAPAMEPVGALVPDDPDRVVEMEITGEFSFPLELSVGATFLITETGQVTADIAAVHAIVLGRYAGTLRASRSIRVGPSARVEGTLEAPEIEIAEGATVNGLVAGEPYPAAESADDVTGGGSSSFEGPEDAREEAGSAVDESGAAGLPADESAQDATAEEDEIFVASPIFVEGVSRG